MTYTYPATKRYDCCEHCMHWDNADGIRPGPPTPCSYITNVGSGEPHTTCQERK